MLEKMAEDPPAKTLPRSSAACSTALCHSPIGVAHMYKKQTRKMSDFERPGDLIHFAQDSAFFEE